jgi:hypothetical protein
LKKGKRVWRDPSRQRSQRTKALAAWHGLLLDRLTHSEAEGLLDRLIEHPALGGPELTFLQARLAHHRDDISRAHDLVHDALAKLPGHGGFLEFANMIGAPLPPPARQIVETRPR